MNIRRIIYPFMLMLLMAFTGGCIHEYPDGKGENPTTVNIGIELIFDLRWENLLYNPKISQSRAKNLKNHRFVIELSRNGETYKRDYLYLSDEEFSEGIYRHKLSFPLSARDYDIGVWYDQVPDSEDFAFYNIDDLSNISLLATGITDVSKHYSAFGTSSLNLREFEGIAGATATVTVELKHSGAIFQIIATDIQKFITDNRPALLQGEFYNLKLEFVSGSSGTLNLYKGEIDHSFSISERRGDLELPFAVYDELKIAEAFLLCEEEENIKLSLIVYNSAQMIVTRTEPFSIPLKRGYITTVTGEFLSNPLNGAIIIDNIWEGEYNIEINN